MAPEEKPYRVYRGGRRGPKLPTLSRSKRGNGRAARPKSTRKGPVRPPWRRALRWLGIGFSIFVLWVAAWSLAGYFSFRDGVKEANKRLPASAEKQLSDQGGLPLTESRTILLLGTDTRPGKGQQGLRHSDSMMLVRTDPDHHRLYYLSIPRDLYVDIPGYGASRINTAYQVGGAAARHPHRARVYRDRRWTTSWSSTSSASRSSSTRSAASTSPCPGRSSRTSFDCPFDARAARAGTAGGSKRAGSTWTAGARSSTRGSVENRAGPSENDITRAERQQEVMQAIADKLVGVGHVPPHAVQRGRAAPPTRNRPLREPAAPARLGEVPRGHDDPLHASEGSSSRSVGRR